MSTLFKAVKSSVSSLGINSLLEKSLSGSPEELQLLASSVSPGRRHLHVLLPVKWSVIGLRLRRVKHAANTNMHLVLMGSEDTSDMFYHEIILFAIGLHLVGGCF